MNVIRRYVRGLIAGVSIFVVFEFALIVKRNGGIGVDHGQFFRFEIHSLLWWLEAVLVFASGYLLSASQGSAQRAKPNDQH